MKSVLQSVLDFFKKEAEGRCRIGLHRPMDRLIEATGLSRDQIRYRFHQAEQRAERRKKIRKDKVLRLSLRLLYYLSLSYICTPH